MPILFSIPSIHYTRRHRETLLRLAGAGPITASPLLCIAEGHGTRLPVGSGLLGPIPLRFLATSIATAAVGRSALFPGDGLPGLRRTRTPRQAAIADPSGIPQKHPSSHQNSRGIARRPRIHPRKPISWSLCVRGSRGIPCAFRSSAPMPIKRRKLPIRRQAAHAAEAHGTEEVGRVS
jgi:hypothetical protein